MREETYCGKCLLGSLLKFCLQESDGEISIGRAVRKGRKTASSGSTLTIIKEHHRGSTSNTDNITAQHPTYLHELYCSVTNLLGDDAIHARIAKSMNQQLAVNQDFPTFNLTHLHLF